MRPRKKIRLPPSLLKTFGFAQASLLLVTTISICSIIPFAMNLLASSDSDYSKLAVNSARLGLVDIHHAQQQSTIHFDAPTVVFYNIFISEKEPEIALRIVTEQVEQLGKSYAAVTAAASRNQSLHVQYVTIGRGEIITEDWMNQTCHEKINLRCSHVKHVQTGFEEVTLTAIHDFCLTNPVAQVTYIHSKGSHHPRQGNEYWRYSLTEAVLSHWCINRHKDCNLCGLQFYAMWAPFLPGNMWTAKCSYIRKLLRPADYAAKLMIITKKVLMMRLKGQLQTEVMKDRGYIFGLDGYASKMWVGSHPTVKPCDCDLTGRWSHYLTTRVEASAMSGGLAPRHVGSPAFFRKKLMNRLYSNIDNRLRDYFTLPGNLFRWYKLYGEIPDDSSWAWTWFPDGDFWQQQTGQWGEDAVDMVTRNYTTELLVGPGAFVSTGQRAALPFAETDARDWSRAVFYDLYISQDAEDLTYDSELGFALEQLRLIESLLQGRGRHVSLYYRTVGHKLLHEVDLCGNISLLECRRLGHEDAFYGGETLLGIQGFCQSSPNRVVSLIHNIPARDIDNETMVRKHRFLRHATMASLSDECLLVDGEKCNLCGLAFFTEPKLAMAGDMWTASCSYINRLYSPVLFQEKMGQFIEDALFMKLSGKDVLGPYEHRVDALGLDKFAVEHWVGSHPSLLPCDVSPEKFGYWLESEPRAQEHSLGIGARHRGPPFSYDGTTETVIHKENHRHSSAFSFLPGQLEKWYHLYGQIPNNSSWVWS